MKELDSFTVEQLNDFIKSDHAQCGDVAALARIALAAKRAEPVDEIAFDMARNIMTLVNETNIGGAVQLQAKIQCFIEEALTTTPQLNSPQGWIKCSDQMPEDDEYYLTHSTAGVDVTIFHDGRFQDEYATHWMPLPAAPESE
ncbi:DUF551 domain-containing protein [Yersinia enterocolitica]|nr:DUF551 domain-containing protein [Yersinia enterocolitica]HDV5960277.1 DUF551 domain-containing protein [Yersinia enterocolitica]HEB4793594.1 DUF551 domain-containing protein [Yersinia enterocolitica]HEM9133142.1 DUF551 domain-containing protein [Yersinia enterocolitica]HEN3352217.1 DUF551 domain-containing protein [Yersinia enterocolitica]